MGLNLSDPAFVGVVGSGGVPTPDFETDFPNADLWSEQGTVFYVSGNAMNNGSAGNNSDQRMYLTSGLGFSLSDSQWSIRYTYKCTTGGDSPQIQSGCPMYVSDAVAKPLTSSFDMIGIFQENGFPLQIAYTNGSGRVGGSTTSALTSATEYYIQLQRTSTTSTNLTIFTDDTYETEFESPITQTISSGVTGLDQLAISSTDNGSRGTPRSAWYVKDLKIWNGVNF